MTERLHFHFTRLWWPLPHIDTNQPGVHVSSPLLPRHHPEAPSSTPSLWVVSEHRLLSAPLHASNLHWSSVLHMVIYITYSLGLCFLKSIKLFKPHKAGFLFVLFFIFLHLFWESWTSVRTFNPFTCGYILIPRYVCVFSPSFCWFYHIVYLSGRYSSYL